jgi:hypothetical protein
VNNPALTCGIRNRSVLKCEDLLPVSNENETLQRLFNLRMTDLITDGQKINKAEFNRKFNIAIPNDIWMLLDKIRNAAVLRYGGDDYKPVKPIETFMNTLNKGSKKVRKILCAVTHEFIPHNMIKFADNTETIIGLDNDRILNSLWNRGYFSNDFRMFLFKLHNNTLPVNTILSHFVRGVGRNCTFCDILENPESEDENVLHFFYNCQLSKRLRHNFLTWLTDNDLNNASRREFFTGFRMQNNYYNEVLNVSCKLFYEILMGLQMPQNNSAH